MVYIPTTSRKTKEHRGDKWANREEKQQTNIEETEDNDMERHE